MFHLEYSIYPHPFLTVTYPSGALMRDHFTKNARKKKHSLQYIAFTRKKHAIHFLMPFVFLAFFVFCFHFVESGLDFERGIVDCK